MLRVGLSGGIGSGKSTAARVLAERGAVVVDADAIARGVLAPGGPGLAEVIDVFGAGVLAPDGTLDRAALAARVFADPGDLARLESITHPLIWAEADRQFAAVADDGIAVHDMPLLVEKRMSPEYHLVIVVLTAIETRVRRLVEQRGLTEGDARARIRAQASDAERREAADVVLTNDGPPADLGHAVHHLWESRIAPYAANLAAGRPAGPRRPAERLAERGEGQGRRIAARVRRALALAADEASPAPVWNRSRAGVQELRVPVQCGVPLPPEAVRALAAAGFPVLAEGATDHHPDEPEVRLGNCDPAWPIEILLTR